MTKTERVKAAILFQELDKIPIGMWPHFTPYDQDYETLAREHYKFYKEMNLDFVKLMPYGLYAVEDYGVKIEKYNLPDQWAKINDEFIKESSDWDKIIPLDVTKGTYGKQTKYAEKMLELMLHDNDIAPVIQTIYSPSTTLYKLIGWDSWDALKTFIETSPEKVHKALETITQTTIEFVKENLKIGVSGFFFASQLANYRFMTDGQYDEFGEKYDLQVFEAFSKEAWFNIVHVHSFTQEESMSMFSRLSNYPANCINWHDRWVGPSITKARTLTNKCIVGGINEEQYLNKVNYEELYDHVRAAFEMGGETGFMFGPGCTIYEDTPLTNFFAVRIAAEKFGRLK